jgi:hypothetical protein
LASFSRRRASKNVVASREIKPVVAVVPGLAGGDSDATTTTADFRRALRGGEAAAFTWPENILEKKVIFRSFLTDCRFVVLLLPVGDSSRIQNGWAAFIASSGQLSSRSEVEWLLVESALVKDEEPREDTEEACAVNCRCCVWQFILRSSDGELTCGWFRKSEFGFDCPASR